MRRKLLSIFLVLCMVFTMLPVSAKAEEVHTTSGTSKEIIEFACPAETEKTVSIGTSIEELMLPDTLIATVRTTVIGGEEAVQVSGGPEEDQVTDFSSSAVTGSAIKVTWGSEPGYDRNTEGKYVFTPVIEGYIVKAKLPKITVTVEAPRLRGLFGPMGATDEYDVWVGGVRVTSENMNSVTGSAIRGTVTYDAETNTLTLDNAEITGAYIDEEGNMGGIYATSDLKVKRIGHSSIVIPGLNTYRDGAGIYVYSDLSSRSNLTITGEGSLGITGGPSSIGSSSTSSGIFIRNGDLIVESGSLNAYGGGSTDYSYGIKTTGNVQVKDNAIVEATGASANKISYGIHASDITIDGGEVTASGGSAISDSYGIYGDDDNCITINGGTVTAASSSEAKVSKAINQMPIFGSGYAPSKKAGANVGDAASVTDAALASGINSYRYISIAPLIKYGLWVGGVEVTSENKDNITGEGIYAKVTYDPVEYTLTVKGKIDNPYKDDKGNLYGIYATGNLKIKVEEPEGHHSNVIGLYNLDNKSKGDSVAIYVAGDLTFLGDKLLWVYSGTASNGSSYGIKVGGNLTLEGKSVWVNMDDASEFSCAVSLTGEKSILMINNNAELSGSGGRNTPDSRGIFLPGSESKIIVNSGRLSGTSGHYSNESYGIKTSGSIHIKGDSYVSARGFSSNQRSYGIYANDITIESGEVSTGSGTAAEYSCGIYCISDKSINLNGGNVTASSGAAREYKAMNQVPVFGEYTRTIKAKIDGGEVEIVTEEDLEDSTKNYTYLLIKPVVKYDIWVGDMQVTSDNASNVLGDSNRSVIYDPSTNTLTLNNAMITEAYTDEHGNKYGIYSEGVLNLERIGHSSIVIPSSNNKDGVGIHVCGDLIISGGGTLVVTGGQITGETGESSGIHIDEGDLTVKGGNLIVSGAPATGSSANSYGICIHNGSLTIKDGTVEATGDNAGFMSTGVFLNDVDSVLTVDGGTLIADGGVATTDSYGILTQGSVLVNGNGVMEATSNSAKMMSYGIYSTDNITIDNGTVKAIGDSAEKSYGIFSLNNIHINGSTVTAASSNDAKESQAMNSTPNFDSSYDPIYKAGANVGDAQNVTNDQFLENISSYKYIEIKSCKEYNIWVGGVQVTKANANDVLENGTVIYDPGAKTLTLIDASIYDIAYVDEGGHSYGIYSAIEELNIELIGHSSISIPAPAEDKDGTAIYVLGDLIIYGDGKLVATGSSAMEGGNGDSYGVHVDDGDLIIVDGTVIASGAPVYGDRSGSYGICVHDGSMGITGDASVEANGYEGYLSSGVYFGGEDVSLAVLEDSSLKAKGSASNYVSYGVYFMNEPNEVLVDGGRIIAIGGSAVTESSGISASIVTVNGGTLEASGGFADTISYGINSREITINGGTVIADSGFADITQAMSMAPTFANGYSHRNNAGTNGADATYVTDAALTRGITGYRYIEITPYTPTDGNGGDNSGSGSYTPAPAPTTKPNEPTTATVDSNGTANINITEQYITDAIVSAKAKAEKDGTSSSEIKIVIHVSTNGSVASNFNANLPKATIQQLINNKVAGIELVIDNPGITVGFNQSALIEINRQANSDVQINVTRKDSSMLSAAAREVIDRRPVYDFEATYQNGSKEVTDFGSGRIYASIPYTPASNEVAGYLYIVYVDEEGNTIRVSESIYDESNNRLIFITDHFSLYGVGYTSPSAKFTDIDTHWAKDCIDYVVSRDLISGTKKTTFSPDRTITRASLVSALGKLAGVDTKEYTKNSFTDVKADSSYRPYIEWAYSEGILQGISSKKFGPDQSVTREEITVIMANYVKAMGYKLPASRSEIKFKDASSISKKYRDAVKTMQQAGIIMGKADNKFDPKANATRAEFSAMIHQLVMLIIDPTTAQGWAQNDDGQYMYYKNGKAVTDWQTIDGVKYFYNAEGTLKTGWVKDDIGNSQYYSGKQMLVGFYKIDTKSSSNTYYFDESGNMVSDKWLKIDGKWYYFNADGTLAGSPKIEALEADEKGVRKAK